MYINEKYPDFKKYIDLDAGLGRIRGNKKIYKRMLGMFLASDEFAKFEAALEAGDTNAAGDVAHAIKGMTGNLSLDAVFHLSEALMVKFREGTVDEALINEYREALKITLEIVEDVSTFLDE